MNDVAVADVAVEDRKHMGSVEELMKILMVSNMLHEQQQIDLLMNHIAEAEKNHLAVMQELSDIKSQLNEILSRTDSAISGKKHLFSDLTKQMANALAAQGQKLQNMKQDLNQKARRLVQKFKEIGIKALNNVCGFLGIKEKLIAMRDQARSAETDMKIALEKLDAFEKEVYGAALHIGNAGKIVTGKEGELSGESLKEQGERKEPVLFRLFRNHYQKRQRAYAKKAERLNGAIEKFSALEQKASVLKKLSENKKKATANDKDSENGRKALSSELKRDETLR